MTTRSNSYYKDVETVCRTAGEKDNSNTFDTCAACFEDLKRQYPEYISFFEENKQRFFTLFHDVRSEKDLEGIALEDRGIFPHTSSASMVEDVFLDLLEVKDFCEEISVDLPYKQLH